MHKASKPFLCLLFALAATPFAAQAGSVSAGDVYHSDGGGDVQVGRIQSCAGDARAQFEGFARFDARYLAPMGASLSCTNKDVIEGFIKVTEITFSGIGIAGMCSGAGAAVGISAATIGMGLELVDLVVSRMPCDNPADDEKVKNQAKQTVCEVLIKKGFECDPNHL
jgi:hypothetical protein